jgi:hypothetical protein
MTLSAAIDIPRCATCARPDRSQSDGETTLYHCPYLGWVSAAFYCAYHDCDASYCAYHDRNAVIKGE